MAEHFSNAAAASGKLQIPDSREANRMNRSMAFRPANIAAETDHLTPREFGALMRLAMHLWQVDELPKTAAAIAQTTGLGIEAAETMRPRLLSFFEPGGTFAILRDVALVRYQRRARAGRLGGLRARSGRAPKPQEGHA